jgi:hypothetical protein
VIESTEVFQSLEAPIAEGERTEDGEYDVTWSMRPCGDSRAVKGSGDVA